MNFAKTFRLILGCLIPILLFSSCKQHKKSAEQLHVQAKKELIAGSTSGVISVGTGATTGAMLLTATGGGYPALGTIACGIAALTCIPVAVITGTVSIILIVTGVKHRRKAKRLAKLEIEHIPSNEIPENNVFCIDSTKNQTDV